MKNSWKELQPKNIYQGRKNSPLKEENRAALLTLYQPLIGGISLSIYFTLLTEVSQETGKGPEGIHADLFNSLSCGLPQFLEARKKLEGIGLLDVYYKEDPSLGPFLLYELIEPMSPSAFFKDSVLSFLLLEKVGERYFDHLVKRFEPKKFSKEGYKKITKKFLEVYQFSEVNYATCQEHIDQIQKKFDEEKTKTLMEKESLLDWNFLNDWLKKKHIGSLNDSIKEQLVIYHKLYGFDELALADLVIQAYDFTTQSISTKELQRNILIMNRKSNGINKNKDSKESKEIVAYIGLSNAAIALIQEVQSIPPMKYLEALKRGKGGYVSKEETWLLQDLVTQSGLSNSVINVLINYVLVIKNNSNLNARFANTIANEWAQKKIKTPEEAINHIKKLSKSKKQETKKTISPYRNSHQKIRREELPDWVNKPNDEKKISSEKKAEIDRRFKEYLEKKEEIINGRHRKKIKENH